MKKILLIISLLFTLSISYSQTINEQPFYTEFEYPNGGKCLIQDCFTWTKYGDRVRVVSVSGVTHSIFPAEFGFTDVDALESYISNQYARLCDSAGNIGNSIKDCNDVSGCLTQEPALSTIEGIIDDASLNCETVVQCVLNNISDVSDALAEDIFNPANTPNPFLDSLSSNMDCTAVQDCVADAFDPNQPNAFIDSLNNYLALNAPVNCNAVAECVTSSPFLDSLASAMSMSPVVDAISDVLSDPCSGPPRSYFHTIEVAAAGPLTTGQQDASILATTVAGGGSLTHGNYTIVSVTQNCEVGNATTQLYANGAAILPTFGNGVTAISHSGGAGDNIFLRTTAANGASHCWYSIGILTEIPPCP